MGRALNQANSLPHPSRYPFSHPLLPADLPHHDASDPDPDRGLLGSTTMEDIPSDLRLAARLVYAHGLRPQDPGR